MNTLKTTAGAIALALLLGCSWMLDGPEDHQGEWAQSDALKALQESEAGTARREAAGQAVCREHGEAVAMWTASGDLVCRPRKGPAVARIQL